VLDATLEEFGPNPSARSQPMKLQDRILKFMFKCVSTVHTQNVWTLALVLLSARFYVIVHLMIM
jgi:hypothetical protein